MHILYENLVDSLIWEETFEITIENVNRCLVYCTRLMVSLQPTRLRVDWKRLYMYKKGHFFWGGVGGLGPVP